MAIWNTALTSAEVSALYNSGNALNASYNSGNYNKSSHLVAYWQFKEGSGTVTNTSNEAETSLSAHIVTSGTCESAGYNTVTSAAGCLAAGALTNPKINGGAAADQPTNGYGSTGTSRTKGCTVHNFNLSNGGKTQYFPYATGTCGTASFNCICTAGGDLTGTLYGSTNWTSGGAVSYTHLTLPTKA